MTGIAIIVFEVTQSTDWGSSKWNIVVHFVAETTGLSTLPATRWAAKATPTAGWATKTTARSAKISTRLSAAKGAAASFVAIIKHRQVAIEALQNHFG